MANIVDFLVKVKDLASGPLQKIASTGQNSFSKMQSGIDKLTGRLSMMKTNIQDIDAKLESLKKTRAISLDGSQIRRINGEIDSLQAKKDRLEGGRSGGLGSFFRTGLAIAGVGSLALLGGDIMSKGIDRQINQIALETLVGKKPGDLLNKQLIDYAQKSIYGNEIMGEGKLLAGSGVKAHNIMPLMHMLGDLGTGDPERMKTLALAFSEANSTGYLTGRQEMMMRTALFNPFEAMSSVTHKSVGELKKDMEKGKIGINLLVEAMEYATGPMGRWYQMEEKIAASGAGKWIAFKGALTTLAGTIGGALMPALGAVSELLNGLINNTPALYAIGEAIGAMTAAWGAYTIVTNWAAISTAALELAAYWPLAVVGAAAGAIGYLCSLNDQYADSTNKSSKTIISPLSALKEFFKDVIYWGEYLLLTVENIWQSLTHLGNAMIDMAKGNVSQAIADVSGDTDAYKKREKLRIDRDWHKAMFYNGKDDNGNKFKSPIEALLSTDTGKYQLSGEGGGIAGGDTKSSITGGGVRSITINVAKFQDKTEIHAASVKESANEIEDIFKQMFLRITNSAATAMQ